MPSPLQDLTTESHNPLSRDLDRLSSFEIARLMNQEDALVALAVRDELPAIARAIDLAAATLAAGGRVVYVGAGTSGRLGMLDASEWQPTFGVDPDVVRVILAGGPQAVHSPVEDAEDDEQEGYRRVRETVRSGDLVVGLAASGRTPFVVGALRAARDVGARTVSIACNRPSPIEALADVAIAPVVGPEVLAGSTRLKAGTAQKMVLNMISTGAMVRLGKVYRNLMVDMLATNDKLRRRALRMVRAATGCTEEQAADALSRAGMHVKTAIVMLLAGVGVEEARARLVAAGGFVRRAVQE